MVSKSRSLSEILGEDKSNDKSTDLSPTHPEPPKETTETEVSPTETDVTKTQVERVRDVLEEVKLENSDRALREANVENFDNSGNGVTDNMPIDWDAKAPEGTVIYGPDSYVPSENAIVSGVVSTAVYAGENEFDDKGIKEPDVEEPPGGEVEPPDGEETEPPAEYTTETPVDDTTRKESTSKYSSK